MPISKMFAEVSVDQAKDQLGLTTRQAITHLIRTGQLPGARKVDPKTRNSAWLIPVKAIQALKKKRAQASTA